jgi:hypothetical protein
MFTLSEVLLTLQSVYEPNGWQCEGLVLQKESAEYGACSFKLNDRIIQLRIAKITPRKNGQFVTLWKRIGTSSIMPYDLIDPVDLFIIFVQQGDQAGQFVFPKSMLLKKGIVSEKGAGGKRAIRIYPPWDKPASVQAKKTQVWQLPFFFWIGPKQSNFEILRRLLINV